MTLGTGTRIGPYEILASPRREEIRVVLNWVEELKSRVR